jgi:hypothetical protein
LCTTLVLISVSINNVTTIALVLYANSFGLQLLTPGDEAFSIPLGQPGGVTGSYMVAIVVKDTIELFDEDLIEPDIEGKSEAWVRPRVGTSIRNGCGSVTVCYKGREVYKGEPSLPRVPAIVNAASSFSASWFPRNTRKLKAER